MRNIIKKNLHSICGGEKSNWVLSVAVTLFCAIPPFLIVPGLDESSDFPKRAFIQVGVLIWLIFLAWKIWRKGDLDAYLLATNTSVWLPCLLLLLWMFLGLHWTKEPLLGMPLIWHYSVCLLWSILLLNLLRCKDKGGLLLVGLFISGNLISLLGLFQAWFGIDWFPQAEPPAATFINRNIAAEFVASVMPAGIVLMANTFNSIYVRNVCRILVLSGWAIAIIYIITAASRAGVLAMLGGVLTAFMVFWILVMRVKASEDKNLVRISGLYMALAIITFSGIIFLLFGSHIYKRFMAEWRTWHELSASIDNGDMVTPKMALSVLNKAHNLKHPTIYRGSIMVYHDERWFAIPAAYALYLPADFTTNYLPYIWRQIRSSKDIHRAWAVAATLDDQRMRWEGSSQARLPVWLNTIALFVDHFIHGVGLEYFQAIYPLYKNAWALDLVSRDRVYLYAHNDYLQLAAETGIIGLILFAWIIIATIRALYNMELATSKAALGTLAASIGGCAAIAISAFYGFPFHLSLAPFLIATYLALAINIDQSPGVLIGTQVRVAAGYICFGGIIILAILLPLWEKSICADRLYRQAELAEEAGNFDAVIKNINKLLEFKPKNTRARIMRCYALIKKENYSDAVHDLEMAADVFPYSAHIWHNLGYAYFKSGLSQKAIHAFAREALLLPTAARVHHDLGVLLGQAGDTGRAEAALRLAVHYAPQVEQYRNSLNACEKKVSLGAATL